MPNNRERRSVLDLLIPDDLDSVETTRRWRFAALIIVISVASSAAFALVFLLIGAALAAAALTFHSIFLSLALAYAGRRRRLDVLFVTGAFEATLVLSYLSAASGTFSLGFVMWLFLIPPTAVLTMGLKEMCLMTGVTLVLGSAAFTIAHLGVDVGTFPSDDAMSQKIYFAAWLAFMGGATWIAFMFDALNKRSTQERENLQTITENARRMQAVGELAGGVAHEFNNLLTVIRGTASVIRVDAAGNRAVDDGLVDIERAATRGGEIARELLLFARGREKEYSSECTDTVESLRACLRLIAPILGSNITVTTSIADDLPPVAVNARTLEQSVVNMALNARDAMEDGGGELRIDAETLLLSAAEATLLGIEEGAWVRIIIQDDGIGMDQQTVARVYEPFFTTKESGTGLGMAVVFGLLKQVGGTVEVQSEPGVGTKFSIYLPVAAVPEPADEISRPGSETSDASLGSVAAKSSGKILLVEDQTAVRRMAMRILTREGYEVIEARDGAEALELVEAGYLAQLIVSDVRMPRMGGVGLARELIRRDSKVPIVFMTGFAGSEEEDRALYELGRTVLRKPFAPEDLVKASATFIDRPGRLTPR